MFLRNVGTGCHNTENRNLNRQVSDTSYDQMKGFKTTF